MGKPQAPKPASPQETASAQTASNRETAITQTGLNAINQYGPQGNVTYAQNGKWADGTPRFTQTTSLTPQAQRIFDTGMRTQGNLASVAEKQSRSIGSLLSNRFTTNGLPAGGRASSVKAPGYTQFDGNPTLRRSIGGAGNIQSSLGVNDYSADRQKVEDALMARMNPQIERDRAALEASLANRGIRLGSNNYSAAQEDFGRTVNDARLGAVLGAGEEQTRMQGLALNAGNFANNAQAQRFGQNAVQAQFGNAALQQMFDNRNTVTGANNNLADKRFANSQTMFGLKNTERNQALNERLTTRNQALNENIGLATGTQVGMPQFGATPQTGVAGTDVGGITTNYNNAQQGAYNTQLGQWNNTAGGLFSLGASALPFMFSDERLKEDIAPTGEKVAGVPVKDWTWKDSGRRDRGVIAQDVEKKHPEMVKKHSSGYRMVNYGGLMRLGESAMGRAA